MKLKTIVLVLTVLFSGYGSIFANKPTAISGKSPRIKWAVDLRQWNFEGDAGFRETAGLGMRSFLSGPQLFESYQNRPEELKNILKNQGLRDWMLHVGTLSFDGSDKTETLKYLEKMAVFASRAGAKFLLVSTEKRDAYPPGKAKLAKLALALDALAGIAEKQGLRVLLENSMHSICQTADELEFTHSQCKNKKVGILLDLAMMAQSGTAPEIGIRHLGKKIEVIRFNDISKPVKGFAGSNERNYRLEIPGKGNYLQYAEILAALKKIRFKGFGLTGNPSGDAVSPFPAIREGKEWLSKAGFVF